MLLNIFKYIYVYVTEYCIVKLTVINARTNDNAIIS